MERKQKKENELYEDNDQHFAYIAGYTDGGAAFGVSWEEWEEFKPSKDDRKKKVSFTNDFDLPF